MPQAPFRRSFIAPEQHHLESFGGSSRYQVPRCMGFEKNVSSSLELFLGEQMRMVPCVRRPIARDVWKPERARPRQQRTRADLWGATFKMLMPPSHHVSPPRNVRETGRHVRERRHGARQFYVNNSIRATGLSGRSPPSRRGKNIYYSDTLDEPSHKNTRRANVGVKLLH